jgi:hypothetical protein
MVLMMLRRDELQLCPFPRATRGNVGEDLPKRRRRCGLAKLTSPAIPLESCGVTEGASSPGCGEGRHFLLTARVG